MDVYIQNTAVQEGRLFAFPLNSGDPRTCYLCGERLWQWPKPEYWNQYPLPGCFRIDGHLMCSPKCTEDYLLKHPVTAGKQLQLF